MRMRRRAAWAVSATILVMAAIGLGATQAWTAGGGPEEYPTSPSGLTYGKLPVDGDRLPLDRIPDLVAVVGDHGIEGFADARLLLGVGEEAPSSPEEALAWQAESTTTRIPVVGPDGLTVIDTFTLSGHDAGGAGTKVVGVER